MHKELNSGIYESLRARCGHCGHAIARHPFCSDCGRPQRCGDEAGWLRESATPEVLHCPMCADVAQTA